MTSWRQFFNLRRDFREQTGQMNAFVLASQIDPREARDEKGVIQWLFEFCTGYGKTLVAYGIFWILKKRGIVDRMLVLVPTDDQRTQFAADCVDKANPLLGIDLAPAWTLEKADRIVRLMQQGECEVIVATYQQMVYESSIVTNLLEAGGRWLLVLDECHHLGQEGVWANRVSGLPGVAVRLGLTATPIRRDRAALLGVPSVATLRVTYRDAFEEQVVKRVCGFEGKYTLDVDVNGEHRQISTESLREEEATDFSRYEIKRQLRYNPNYVSQMLVAPLQDLQQREARYPGQNQMVVFAMTCKHAHYLCDQLNAMSQDLGLPFRAQWIGVGEGMEGATKSLEENKGILKAYKKGEFHILVQVAKAEEGFDVHKVSVLVFLHLIGADGKLLQQIGRGLRRNKEIPFEEDTVSIYFSAETPIGQVVKSMEMEIQDLAPRNPSVNGEREGQLVLFPIPDIILIDSRHDGTSIVTPDGIDPLTARDRMLMEKYRISEADYVRDFMPFSGRALSNQPFEEMNPQVRLKRVAEQVEANAGRLAGHVLQILKRNGTPFMKDAIGTIRRTINLEWNRVSGLKHSEMLEPDFHRKNKWLQNVDQCLAETKEIPSWIRW